MTTLCTAQGCGESPLVGKKDKGTGGSESGMDKAMRAVKNRLK